MSTPTPAATAIRKSVTGMHTQNVIETAINARVNEFARDTRILNNKRDQIEAMHKECDEYEQKLVTYRQQIQEYKVAVAVLDQVMPGWAADQLARLEDLDRLLDETGPGRPSRGATEYTATITIKGTEPEYLI